MREQREELVLAPIGSPQRFLRLLQARDVEKRADGSARRAVGIAQRDDVAVEMRDLSVVEAELLFDSF